MSRRVNGKAGNRVRRRANHPTKVRGGSAMRSRVVKIAKRQQASFVKSLFTALYQPLTVGNPRKPLPPITL